LSQLGRVGPTAWQYPARDYRSITKQGSAIVRFLLGQAVLHVLKRDPVMRQWYKAVKNRRGSKIARVAVMRRIIVAIWHLLKFNEPYQPGGSLVRRAAGQRARKPRTAKPNGVHVNR
jgi:hypothetical protein